MKDKEIRAFNMELRIKKEDETPKIAGHAAVFDSWSDDLGGFREKIAKGAFTNTLKNADVRALFNHDPNFVLGRNKSGTLDLKEDQEGLYIEVTPPDTQWARDLMTSIERQDINQMSFGFRTVKDRWTISNNDKGLDERELLEVELFDVSPVTYPAYPETKVGIRSAQEAHAEAVQEHKSALNRKENEKKNAQESIRRKKLDLLEKECM